MWHVTRSLRRVRRHQQQFVLSCPSMRARLRTAGPRGPASSPGGEREGEGAERTPGVKAATAGGAGE